MTDATDRERLGWESRLKEHLTPLLRSLPYDSAWIRAADEVMREQAAALEAAEADAREWEKRYEELLEACGGVWPG